MKFQEKILNTDDDVIWTCQYCGIHNVVWVDLTVGTKQDFMKIAESVAGQSNYSYIDKKNDFY